MSLLRRLFKKKEQVSEIKEVNETKRIYFTAEFQAFGDMTKDGVINFEEFMRLMMLLGYTGGRDGCKRAWKYANKPVGGHMTQEEYINFMFDPKIEAQTNQWRELFGEFDHDGSGWATRNQVLEGLEKMGMGGDKKKLKAMVEKMDDNNDNKIYYVDFIKAQLNLD